MSPFSGPRRSWGVDPRTGRFASLKFADYHLPLNADIDRIEVEVAIVACHSASRVALGAIGVVGVAAAIANAVYHATGKRYYDLVITADRVMRLLTGVWVQPNSSVVHASVTSRMQVLTPR